MNLRNLHQEIASIALSTQTNNVITRVDDDDCAVVRVDSDILVATTDYINSSPAVIELGEGTWRSLGQLVACHNFADLAGTGCSPKFFLTGICVPPETEKDQILDFIKGVCEICGKYNCALIGGDTKYGKTRAIYGTALGTPCGKSGPFLRTHALPDYSIIASGNMGSFAAAVTCLTYGESIFTLDDISEAKDILFRTDVPFEFAERISGSGCKCAGTDISDGLVTDIMDICQSSSVRAVLYEDLIPVDEFTEMVAGKLSVPRWSFSFASGGDFSCVYGVPSYVADEYRSENKLIGHFESGSPAVISKLVGQPLSFYGHKADRALTFAEEIQNNIIGIRDYYGD